MPTLSTHLCDCGCGAFTNLARSTHARFGHIAGQPFRFIKGHNRRNLPAKGYRLVKVGAGTQLVHRVRAEKALGKPLPPCAEVHHADGSKRADAPLVICQDRAYHKLLHVRMRVKAAGGNPNTDLYCSDCKLVKPKSEFHPSRTQKFGYMSKCKSCGVKRNRLWVQQRQRMAS